MLKTKWGSRGDTIVEVLIAITIASFAMGISYATAQRSLQQSITAGEHNEALNLIEQQLADLELRYQNTPSSSFEAQFGYPKTNYCLNNTSTGPGDTINQWTPYFNYDNTSLLSQSLVSSTTPDSTHPYYYNSSNRAGCEKMNQSVGAIYYINISTSQSGAIKSPTLYHVVVRWAQLGTGQTSQANMYFKLDGAQNNPLGYQPASWPAAAANRSGEA